MKFKRCFISIIIISFFLSLVVSAEIKPTDRFYVNDYANVLSNELEDYIYENSKQIYTYTGAQIVVTTIETLNGEDIKEYSLNLAREWGIGTAGENNGVLILLVTGDRKIRVEVGYGLEGALPDGKVGTAISTYGKPYFAEDNFETGIEQLYMSLILQVMKEYGLEFENQEEYAQYISSLEEDDDVEFGLDVIIGIILIFIIVLMPIALPLIAIYLLLFIIDKIFKTNFTTKINAWFKDLFSSSSKGTHNRHDNYDSYSSYDSSDSYDSGGGGDFGGGGSDSDF